jgi:hypothetical protein
MAKVVKVYRYFRHFSEDFIKSDGENGDDTLTVYSHVTSGGRASS